VTKIVLTTFLVPLARQSPFAHLQLVRLLAELQHKLPSALGVEILQKVLETPLPDEAEAEFPLKKKLGEAYKGLLTRHASKLTAKNALFVFEYTEKLTGKPVLDRAKIEKTRSTEQLASLSNTNLNPSTSASTPPRRLSETPSPRRGEF